MTGPLPLSFYASRGVIYYTPANLLAEKTQPVGFPEPPCRPRQRRPHSIHITRIPAGFAALELGIPQPPPEPKKSSRIIVELRKLASRENAKRVLGSVFSSLSSTSSTFSTASSSAAGSTRSSSPASTRAPSFTSAAADSATLYSRRSGLGIAGLDDSEMAATGASGQPSSSVNDLESAQRYAVGAASITSSLAACKGEKPVCSGNGIACFIVLAEPTVFLTGLDQDGTTRNSTTSTSAILRGILRLDVSKSVKIKAVTLKFTGTTRTEWPEGIPPGKTETFEQDSIRTQVMPFFNAVYEGSETGYGTMCTYQLRNKSANSSVTNLSSTNLEQPRSPGISMPIISKGNRSSTLSSSKDLKRLSLQGAQSRSFQKGESPYGPTPQQKGYKIFHPGVYEYSFEIPIDNNSPETTSLQMASVKWQLEALVERSGYLRANLQGFKEVPVVRSPSEDSLELVEPISISRQWEDQLHYEIMISGKSFPLGSKIPIAFKLTPLAKVQVHKLKVYVSENIEYFTNNRRVTRKDITRKILLLEKVAGRPLAKEYSTSEVKILAGGEMNVDDRQRARESIRRAREREASRTGTTAQPLPDVTENMLGDLDLGEQYWGQTEIEMNVQLPTCKMMQKDRTKELNHDCTWKNVNVHHWIKIVMRISRLDADDPEGKKRRHFEISIDSPFSILNCRATRDNLSLPEYTDVNGIALGQQHVCGCPNADATDTAASETLRANGMVNGVDGAAETPEGPETFEPPSLQRPPQAHLSAGANVQRPIHMLRHPSYNPPAFDAEAPPPPAPTPPPEYDHVVGTPSFDSITDYFSRLNTEYDNEEPNGDTDDEDMSRASSRGRVNVANPRTPGGRINRSMDIDRNFMNFNPETMRMEIPSTATGLGIRQVTENGGSSIDPARTETQSSPVMSGAIAQEIENERRSTDTMRPEALAI